MNLLQKPTLFQNVCAIELATSAIIKPAQNNSLQPFGNTYVDTTVSKGVYFGKSSARLSQEGKSAKAGLLFEQSLRIRFPNSDLLPSKRILEYCKVKYIYIKMSNGQVYFFGRNDYYQNTPPKIAIKNTPNIVEVTYTSTSMFPLALTNGSADHLLGEDIPINFFNL